jgi:hypothetical protein
MAWRDRPHAKLFSLPRAIPSVLASAAQFIWKHKAHSPFTDMWIAIGIIMAVYLVLSTLEAIRNFVVISPVNIYSRQSAKITALSNENETLKRTPAIPEITAQEQRRRVLVSAEMKKLGNAGRKILRQIEDHGSLSVIGAKLDRQFGEDAVSAFLAVAIQGGIISYVNHVMSIKPELQLAVEFVFSSEYSQET